MRALAMKGLVVVLMTCFVMWERHWLVRIMGLFALGAALGLAFRGF